MKTILFEKSMNDYSFFSIIPKTRENNPEFFFAKAKWQASLTQLLLYDDASHPLYSQFVEQTWRPNPVVLASLESWHSLGHAEHHSLK